MMTATLKLAAAAASALLFALCLWQPAGARAPRDGAARKARVKEVFDQRCARCHGGDGRGRTRLGEMLGVPDFTDEKWWRAGVTDARLKASIADGKDEMPAFGRKLTRPEIASLVGYVKEFKKQ